MTAASNISEKLKPFVEHFEFLGYEVSLVNTETNIYFAKNNPSRWSVSFWPFQDGIYLTVAFICQEETKKNLLELLKFINSLNTNYVFCRAVLDSESDLSIQAFYPEKYDKRSFAAFFDFVNFDITGGFSKNEKTKNFLK